MIGIDEKRLVFLHSEGWICSAEARAAKSEVYNRHFFLPIDWLTSNTNMITEVTYNGDIIFVKGEEVAVIKRGLENVEMEASEAPGKRPSLIGRKRPSLRTSYGSS